MTPEPSKAQATDEVKVGEAPGGWYCHKCDEYVSNDSVTYTLHHQLCGAYLGGTLQSMKDQLTASAKAEQVERQRAERAEARNLMLDKAVGDIGYGLRSLDKTSRVVQLLVGIVDSISPTPEAPDAG